MITLFVPLFSLLSFSFRENLPDGEEEARKWKRLGNRG